MQYQEVGECKLGLRIPRNMGCRGFDPGMGRFCSKPGDFAGSAQIVQMATFFGVKGVELKKIKQMAAREEKSRRDTPAA